MNLYGFVGNDGANYADVVGLWERDNWTGKRGTYKGHVCAEKNDTWKGLVDLVLLKSGPDLNLPETAPVPGTNYSIASLLVELERQTRAATVLAATKFALKFETRLIPWVRIKSTGVEAAFVQKDNQWGVACLPATALVMAKGVLDTIGATDFDNLYTLFDFDKDKDSKRMIEISPVGTFDQMLLGDWAYVGNFKNYKGLPEWSGENIVKLNDKDLWGHGTAATTLSTMEAALKKLNTNNVDPGDFRGFEGNLNGFTNISKLGMNVFDNRNWKLRR